MKRLIQFVLLLLVTSVACTKRVDSQQASETNTTPTPTPSVATADRSENRKEFDRWLSACQALPLNRKQGLQIPPKHLLPLKSFADLEGVIDEFFKWSTGGEMAQAELWLGQKPAQADFFNLEQVYFESQSMPFQPFAQKLEVPLGAEVVVHGDFHGDIHSLNRMLHWLNEGGYLDGFKVARPNVYLLFLGDYTDRGIYGSEVIYTLLKLKSLNPKSVWMTRGNHEDVSLTSRYGFLQEFVTKFGRDVPAMRKLSRIYDFLPVVLYLGRGDDFIQCNHGGMEPGFDPSGLLASNGAIQFQFLGKLLQGQFIREHPELLDALNPLTRNQYKRLLTDFVPEAPTVPGILGFMWNDFTVLSDEPPLDYNPGRAWVYGEPATRAILQRATRTGKKLHAVFRAHQHSGLLDPVMRRLRALNGLLRHWQENDSKALLDAENAELRQHLEHSETRSIPEGSVWTFNVAPDSVYGQGCDYTFDTFGILTVRERFEDWTIKVVNQTIIE